MVTSTTTLTYGSRLKKSGKGLISVLITNCLVEIHLSIASNKTMDIREGAFKNSTLYVTRRVKEVNIFLYSLYFTMVLKTHCLLSTSMGRGFRRVTIFPIRRKTKSEITQRCIAVNNELFVTSFFTFSRIQLDGRLTLAFIK